MELADKLLANREIDEQGCWIWTGAISPEGYGRLNKAYAHRLSYETFVGPIPESHQIDHRCRKKACFNPKCLRAVTRAQNQRFYQQWKSGQLNRLNLRVAKELHRMVGAARK